MTRWVLLAVLCVALVHTQDLPPSCQQQLFCDSKVLHHVQMAHLYPDSKTFVDLHLKYDEANILSKFDELLENTNDEPTREQIQQFVDENFDEDRELEMWTPSDHTANPAFLNTIRDEELRQFAKNVHDIWPHLGRKVRQEVFDNPERYSLITIPNGFMIPGGRFREIYYWDTYWIIEGLLISDMDESARGMIENLIELVRKIGHIPNGSRWYYEQRSQPPLLIAMVALYLRKTADVQFLEANIDILESELNYWLDTQTITFEHKGNSHTLLRYNTPSTGPRPESYREDYLHAEHYPSEESKQEFYTEIKSACESGWDFSSRWFIDENGGNTGNLTNTHATSIIPVDLNAIFADALEKMSYFTGILRSKRSISWSKLAKKWRRSINDVLWNDEDGIWYDFDIKNHIPRKYFFPTNVSPLWLNALEEPLVRLYAPRVVSYLRQSGGLVYPGGIPSTLDRTGEQWDFPNAWPPLISIVVNALEAARTTEGKKEAFRIAQLWVRSNMKGFAATKQMFEKYDVEVAGQVGGGGEYNVQEGFGWSNGVILEFLNKYGRTMTAADALIATN